MKRRIGISLCLLDEEVRHDGGRERDRFANDVLGGYFEWVPMCPEMDLGMGVPRPQIRLRVSPYSRESGIRSHV